MQGYGYPFYVDLGYGFSLPGKKIENNPPHIPEENSPVGQYKRKFTVPKDHLLFFRTGSGSVVMKNRSVSQLLRITKSRVI